MAPVDLAAFTAPPEDPMNWKRRFRCTKTVIEAHKINDAKERDRIPKDVVNGGRDEQDGEMGPIPSNWRARRAESAGLIPGNVVLGEIFFTTCTTVCKLEYAARRKRETRRAAAFGVALPFLTDWNHTKANKNPPRAARIRST